MPRTILPTMAGQSRRMQRESSPLESAGIAPCFGLRQHSQKTGHFQTTVDRDAAAALLINKKQACIEFACDDNGFCLTRIELLS